MSVSHPDKMKPCGKSNLLKNEDCYKLFKLAVLKGAPLAAGVNVYLFSQIFFTCRLMRQHAVLDKNHPLANDTFIRNVYCLRFTTHVLKGTAHLLNKQREREPCGSSQLAETPTNSRAIRNQEKKEKREGRIRFIPRGGPAKTYILDFLCLASPPL